MPRRLGEETLVSGDIVETTDLRQLRQESFDNYLAMAQAQPDNDEAQQALLNIMDQAFEDGEVDFLMQNAMVLAATACMDPHMEDTANKANEFVSKATSRDDEILQGSRPGQRKTGNGDKKKSASNKKRQFAASLSQLIFVHMTKQAKSSSSSLGLLTIWTGASR